MHKGKIRVVIAAGIALYSMRAVSAAAQCTNVGGGPPTNEPMLTQKVVLQTGPGGVWADGNDRFKFLKGLINLGVPFDPIATHNVTLTYRVNTVGGPLIVTTTVPVGAPGWTNLGGGRWRYFDTTSPTLHGVRLITVLDFGGGLLIKKILGRDVSNTNTPLAPTDDLHAMLEVYDASNVGVCFDSTLTTCNPAGTICKP
jgi:hypothetical protein